MKRISRSALVEHPAMKLYQLVEDIEAYPRFLPWCAAAVVHAREPGRTRATLTVAVKGIKYSFTTENANRPGETIDMRLVRGPFKRFAGAWRFDALGERAARVEFTLEYEFASRLVAKTLEPLFGRIADTMLDAFVRRANARHGKAQG